MSVVECLALPRNLLRRCKRFLHVGRNDSGWGSFTFGRDDRWGGSEACERENILFLFSVFIFVFRGLLLILRRNLINLLTGW